MKDQAAVELGRKGGKKTAALMTAQDKLRRAKKGATARWKKRKERAA